MTIDNTLLLKKHLMNLIIGKNHAYYITEEQMPLIDYYLNISFHFPLLEQAGVYKIIFSDESWYIGKSKNILKRIWEHLSDNTKSNLEFVAYKNNIIKNNISFTVLKLSDKQQDEKKIIELHLDIDKNHCHNKQYNNRL